MVIGVAHLHPAAGAAHVSGAAGKILSAAEEGTEEQHNQQEGNDVVLLLARVGIRSKSSMAASGSGFLLAFFPFLVVFIFGIVAGDEAGVQDAVNNHWKNVIYEIVLCPRFSPPFGVHSAFPGVTRSCEYPAVEAVSPWTLLHRLLLSAVSDRKCITGV